MKRLIARVELKDASEALRRSGKRIVFTNGCFDLLHPGHSLLLEAASDFGDILLVGLNDDSSLRRLKGGFRPVFPELERAEMLLAFRWVDWVTLFPEDTPLETIELIRPHVLAKGDEYEEDDIVGADFVKSYGGRVIRVKMKEGYSSSALLRKIVEFP